MSVEVLESLLDPREFARRLIGEPLWPHQEQVVLSGARTRVMCAGRQVGKTRTLAVLALHGAFTRADYRVLILSAGEDSARDLLAEIRALASAPLLGGSVFDENASRVVLSNGSSIRCVPASEKQVRGKSVDLLILDEAAQIADELWRAARYSIIARPESRVVMASTPFGSQDRFFAQAFRLGQGGAETYASFHWPSTLSPLVDASLLEDWRRTDPEWVYRQEVLAEWVADQQSYFAADELLEAVADYELVSPERARAVHAFGENFGGAAGIDWGFSPDRSAVALVAPLEDHGLNGPESVFFVPWLEVTEDRTRFTAFIDRLLVVARGYRVQMWASETNGVGAPVTQQLQERLYQDRSIVAQPWVRPVHTDWRRKQSGFGAIKVLLQSGRLVLPRHAELTRQLAALQFTYSETGLVRIAVPERAGHDDLAMALMQAVSCLATWSRHDVDPSWSGEVAKTRAGLQVPLPALPRTDLSCITTPAGDEKSLEAAW